MDSLKLLSMKTFSLGKSLRNSWYLKTPMKHHFYCVCGQIDTVSCAWVHGHHPPHRCSACGQTRYLDAEMFVFNPQVVYWSAFSWHFSHNVTEKSWTVTANVDVPLWDVSHQEIRIHSVVFRHIELDRDGRYRDEEVCPTIAKKRIASDGYDRTIPVGKTVHKKMHAKFRRVFLAHLPDALTWLGKRNLSPVVPYDQYVDLYRFFLRHSHFQVEDFYFWHRRDWIIEHLEGVATVEQALWKIIDRPEKSARKAVLISYYHSTMHDYDPLADYLFARYVRDPNHLRSLLALSSPDKWLLFRDVSGENATMLMDFLHRFYDDKAMKRLWLRAVQSEDSEVMVRDTVRMIVRMGETWTAEHFECVAPDLDAIHDAIIRLFNHSASMQRPGVSFRYDNRFHIAETVINGVRFRLARTSEELVGWGRLLRNCLASYVDRVALGSSTVYGVYERKRLVGAIEIADGRLVQAKASRNRPFSEPMQQIIDYWYNNYLNNININI
jgi:hypothetical protein